MRIVITSSVVGLIGILAGSSGCMTPPAPQQAARDPQIPLSVARIASSPFTKKATGAVTWRVYKGASQTVVMGFGKDNKPVTGVRMRQAIDSSSPWDVSIETLNTKHAIRVDTNDNIVENTLDSGDVGAIYGSARALKALKASERSGMTLPKGFVPFEGTQCQESLSKASQSCTGLAVKCGGQAGIASIAGGPIAGAGAGVRCLVQSGPKTIKCGMALNDAYNKCVADPAAKAEEERLAQEEKDRVTPREPDPNNPWYVRDKNKPDTADQLEKKYEEERRQDEQRRLEEQKTSELDKPAEVQTASALGDTPSEERKEIQTNDAELRDAEQTPEVVERSAGDNAPDPVIADPEPEPRPEEAPAAEDPPPSEEPPAVEEAPVEEQSYGVRIQSKSTAKESAGACARGRILQCGTRKSGAYCRCVKM